MNNAPSVIPGDLSVIPGNLSVIPGDLSVIPGDLSVIPGLTGNLIWLDSIDSTNSEALRHLPELPSGTVIAAREQTAGRGQRGNTWFTEPGQNLTFSIILKGLKLAVSDAHLLNYLASVAVAEFLDGFDVKCSIKWPNDIFVGRSKICGILVENSLSGAEVSSSVIGIGININQKEFPQLSNATSLFRQTGKEYDIKECLDTFLKAFANNLAILPGSALAEKYSSCLFQKGVSAKYHDLLTDQEYNGIICNVEPDGRLHIYDKDNGKDCYYRFKEVSYIL